jgi:hypothetical protein
VFYFTVLWRETSAIRRDLDDRYIPYEIRLLPDGRVAFIFPDLPVPVYARVRKLFGGNGIPLDKIGEWGVVREIDAVSKRFKLVCDWDSRWVNVEDLVAVTK